MTIKQRYDLLYDQLSKDGKLIAVNSLLKLASEKWPNNKILICNEKSITYNQLYKRSLKITQELQKLGVKKNDRVIIYYENSVEFYIAYFGVWHAGAIVAPLNVYLNETELSHIINDAKPKVIIVSENLVEKVRKLGIDIPIIMDIDNKSKLERSNGSTMLASEKFLVESDFNNTEGFSEDEIAAILYTSGTTGMPKGVMLSSKNIIINTIQGIANLEAGPEDRVFCPLPLFHSLPQNVCLWAITIVGSTAIIIPKIDRKNIINGLAHKPTAVVAVPAVFGLFCLMKTLDFSNVRFFFSGGDALSDKIRSYFSLIYRRKIANGYGLTETSPFVSVDLDDFTKDTNTVGQPFIGIECSLRDETEKELPKNQIGALWLKGQNIMKGYYNAPEATDKILKNGWLNTGDLAYFDENGKIVIAGRERDLIVNKGVKIYPQEVENTLLSHPNVLQVGVVGLKVDDEEIPVAFVATKEQDHQNLINQLTQLCRQNLAFYKVPRKFIIKKELPITSTGKVDKKILKAELQQK